MERTRRKKAVILAAHTDDVEFGAAGTMLSMLRAGYEVVMGNMVEGGAEKLGRRTAELTGAKIEWLGFEAGKVEDSPVAFCDVKAFMDCHCPDLIFVHWPVDEHPDHRATGSMAIRYVDEKQKKFMDAKGRIHPGEQCPQLFFYEAISGKQSKCFRPDRYVGFDREIFELKMELMRLYTGNPMTDYMKSVYHHHTLMMEFRARESGACRHAEIDAGIWAEAFVAYPLVRGQQKIVLPGEL